MDPFEREERREEERSRLKRERRDFRKHKEAVRDVKICHNHASCTLQFCH